MKKIICFLILCVVLFWACGAQAQESASGSLGLLPDSHFYFLKVWKEKVQLFFTFNAENKAKQFLHLSEVRLAEYQKMVEKGKDEIAQKTLAKYEKQLNQALAKIEQLKQKGRDIAGLAQEVATTTAKNMEVLTQNLAKVPEAAKEAIERVIEAAQQGSEGLKEGTKEEVNQESAQRPAQGPTQKSASAVQGPAPVVEQEAGTEEVVAPEQSKPICEPGVKCKDSVHQAYQTAACAWKDEIFCQFNCQNGKCQEDPCKDIKCPDSCDGKVRKHNGVCANGQCQYESLTCGFGCENALCKGDPCSGVKCSGLCEGNTRKYNGQCVQGICQYQTQVCDYDCLNGSCAQDPCAGITCPDTCDGKTKKHSGSCANGQCQYSNEECIFGCASGVCKTVDSFTCNYVWYQEILNAKTSELLLKCSGTRPYCRAGFFQCCNYDFNTKEHYNCADCAAGNCQNTGTCASVTCSTYCENGKRYHHGVCKNGVCQYETEDAKLPCVNGAYVESGVIFVTDASFTPSLGGISGADAKCQAEASAAGLPGAWVALLSSSSVNAKDRIPDVVYMNLGGVVLANNKADLFDGHLPNGVYFTPTKQIKEYSVWTGSNTAGTAQSNDHCSDWTYYGAGYYGAMGNSGRSDNEWIWRSSSRYTCGNYAHLYCVLTSF